MSKPKNGYPKIQAKESTLQLADQTVALALAGDLDKNLKILESAASGYKGNNISRGNSKFPEIALTFDLASGDELRTVESLLNKYNIRFTIFLSNERPQDESGSFFLTSNLDLDVVD